MECLLPSALLAHAIFADGVRNVVAGASAIDIKRGLERGVTAALEALARIASPVTTRTKQAQIATVSAHNDPQMTVTGPYLLGRDRRYPVTIDTVGNARRSL